MTKMIIQLITAVLFTLSTTFGINYLDWKVKETTHYKLYFPPDLEYKANDLLIKLEHYRPYVTSFTGHLPQKASIVLEDVGDMPNGFVNPATEQTFLWSTGPSSTGFIAQYEEWLSYVSLHELTHLGQLTHNTGIAFILTRIVGNILTPQIALPNWFIEGLGVVSESNLTPYSGRLNDGLYHAIIKEKAGSGTIGNIYEANYAFSAFPWGGHYTYGGLFLEYLHHRFGPTSLKRFVKAYSRQTLLSIAFPFFGLDSASKTAFGKPFTTLYENWRASLKNAYKKPTLKRQQLTHTGWIKTDILLRDNQLLFSSGIQNCLAPFYRNTKKELITLNPSTQTIQPIAETLSNTQLPLKTSQNDIYIALDEMKQGYENINGLRFGSLKSLEKINLLTKKRTPVLTADFQAFHVTETGTLILFKDRKGTFGTTVSQFKNNEETILGILNLRVSEILSYKSNWLLVAKTENQAWSIYKCEPKTLKTTPLVDTPWAETNITLHNDWLLFAANYPKNSRELFAFDMNSETLHSLTPEHYAQKGVVLNNDLYFIGLNDKGNDIYQIPFNPKAIKQPITLDSSVELPTESISISQSRPAVSESLKKGLIPFARFFPSVFFGIDDMSLFNYTLAFGSDPLLQIYVDTALFSPLTLGYTASISPSSHKLAASYPLYKSQLKGFQQLSTGITMITNGVTSNALVQLSTSYNLPQIRSTLSLEKDLEEGHNIGLSTLVPLQNTSVALSMDLFDKTLQTPILTELPGTAELVKASGTIIKLSLTHKLGSINDGLWNPNIAFGDLYGKLFTHYSSLGITLSGIDHEYQHTIGAELIIETHLFNRLVLPIRICASHLQGGDIYGYVRIGS